VTQLIARNSFEIPGKAVERHADLMLLRFQGASLRGERGALTNPVDRDTLRTRVLPQALRDIQRSWLLERVAEIEGIGVDDAEIEEEIERICHRTNTSIAELRRLFSQQERREELALRMRERKVLDFLISHAEASEAREEPIAG
jgi:trigger factor